MESGLAVALAPEPPTAVSIVTASPTLKSSTEHLPALTGLRFFLAIWVVIHHITGPGMMLEPWTQSLPLAARTFIRAGYLAVGTFFVLSGFVLARRYAGSTWTQKSLTSYAVSRFARIYPVYLLSLLIVAPFIILGFSATWFANYVFLLQGWISQIPVHWNTPAWSLSCELFFYCCFPAAILLIRRQTWSVAIAMAAFACVLTAAMRRFGLHEEWKPLLHFSDFLIGIAAANAYSLMERSSRCSWLSGSWLYIPGCAAAATIIARPDVLWRWTTLNGALRPLNAVVLIGFALGGGVLARALSSPAAVFLGKASYSMYILHVPLLWWYKFAQPINPLPPVISATVYTALVIGISAAVFQYVEEPANQRIRTMFRHHSGRTKLIESR